MSRASDDQAPGEFGPFAAGLPPELAGAQLGSPEVFVPQRAFDARRAGITVAVFIAAGWLGSLSDRYRFRRSHNS